MACLLYCVSLISPNPAPALSGVAEQSVEINDFDGLRVYWSEAANPETLFEGPTHKAAEVKYKQALREIVAIVTAIAFPFPAVVENIEGIDAVIAEQGGTFQEALLRLADMVQYELTATWADEERVDFATPVKGAEYLKRRQKAETRVAAIDAKLKAVTSEIVREWRSRKERRNHHWYALMSRSDKERFIAALRSAGPSEGVRLRLSGPWPPDEFV